MSCSRTAASIRTFRRTATRRRATTSTRTRRVAPPATATGKTPSTTATRTSTTSSSRSLSAPPRRTSSSLWTRMGWPFMASTTTARARSPATVWHHHQCRGGACGARRFRRRWPARHESVLACPDPFAAGHSVLVEGRTDPGPRQRQHAHRLCRGGCGRPRGLHADGPAGRHLYVHPEGSDRSSDARTGRIRETIRRTCSPTRSISLPSSSRWTATATS